MPSYIEGAGEIMNFDINAIMNMMTMMNAFKSGANNASRKRGLDTSGLNALLPLISGMKGNGGNQNLMNMLSAFSCGMQGGANNEKISPMQTENEQEKAIATESVTARKNDFGQDEKARRAFDEIAFAGDEVVYFLRKMRILFR